MRSLAVTGPRKLATAVIQPHVRPPIESGPIPLSFVSCALAAQRPRNRPCAFRLARRCPALPEVAARGARARAASAKGSHMLASQGPAHGSACPHGAVSSSPVGTTGLVVRWGHATRTWSGGVRRPSSSRERPVERQRSKRRRLAAGVVTLERDGRACCDRVAGALWRCRLGCADSAPSGRGGPAFERRQFWANRGSHLSARSAFWRATAPCNDPCMLIAWFDLAAAAVMFGFVAVLGRRPRQRPPIWLLAAVLVVVLGGLGLGFRGLLA